MASRCKTICVSVLAVLFAVFQLYTSMLRGLPDMLVRVVHLGFAIALVFILRPFSKKYKYLRFVDVLFGGAGVLSIIYLAANFQDIIRRGLMSNHTDVVFGVILIVVVLEAARRCTGNAVPILAIIFLIFARYGSIFPGVFKHADFKIYRLVEHLYLSMEGIFGVAIAVSSSFLFLFILFGSFLSETNATDLFMDFGLAIAGKRTGGQAKVAIVSSALLGTVCGSAQGNVATTGAFTIPLMKRSGYAPEFAGAVEAVASTGGQIMPPVMGAAAFIMSEYIGVSYFKIAACAVIPALLYYTACWVQVHFHSARIGLKGMDASEIPKLRQVLKTKGHMFIPLIGLIILIAIGYSPMYSAFFATAATILVSFLRKETRMTPRKILAAVVDAAKSAAPIAITTAVVGIVIGVVSLTGTALLVGNQIISLANNNLFLVLIFTMIVSIILGMGMPTSAVYIVAATFAAPVIVRLGVPVIAAHLFVFYFGILSSVTPPVAMSSIVASGIAGSSPSKTGWLAGRLAIAGFIVPYMFVLAPGLVMLGDSIWGIIMPCISAFVGVFCLGAAIENYMFTPFTVLERTAMFLSSILLIFPETISDIVGILVAAFFIYKNYKRKTSVTKTSADISLG